MELIGPFVSLYILLISTSIASKLPGLLSRDICDTMLLTDLTPVCTCTKKPIFDSLETLCGNIEEAATCLQKEITNTTTRISSFAQLSFDKNNFVSSMTYLCGIKKELGDISECSDNDGVLKCEADFISDLNKTDFSQQQTCRAVDKLSDCFWEEFKSVHLCPERGKILYTGLAEAYLPGICSKFDDWSKGKSCQEFYPKIPTPYDKCVQSVLAKTNCIAHERKGSLHHEDRYWETGFEQQRFIEFSKLTCLIEEERDRQCARDHENNCGAVFNAELNKHTTTIKLNDTDILMSEFCSGLENYLDCVAVALKDCPIEVTNLNYLTCGVMHSSCRCPVDLAKEKMARLKSSSSMNRVHYTCILMLFLCFLHYLHAYL